MEGDENAQILDNSSAHTGEGTDGIIPCLPVSFPQGAVADPRWPKTTGVTDGWLPEGAPQSVGEERISPVHLGDLKLSDEGEPASPTRDKFAGKHSILSPTSVFAEGMWSPTPGAAPLKKSRKVTTLVMVEDSQAC